MLAFVLRRIVQAALVMLTVAFISFMLFQFVGDPVTNILGQDATPQQRLNWRFQEGLYRAYYDSYIHSRLLSENRQEEMAMAALATA